MNLENATQITVPNATIPFVKGKMGDVTTYVFDTTKQGHPMVNAMAGLAVLGENEQLLMINHCAPSGLFPKIDQEFDYACQEMPDGKTHVVFTRKESAASTTDFSATSCGGGCG